MTRPRARAWIGGWLLATALAPAAAQTASPATQPLTRSGREIYAEFRAGLADPTCDTASSPRWRDHFSTAPARMAAPGSDVLPLFGYVVDALRAASLPTEFALIPFVESGYRPAARSAAGPAGLWQMIAVTARDHHVAMRPGYDGRLSPIDSTQAAVRYLKTLHGMFAGDWRLAVMAYNAGEYRVFSALRRSGQVARNANPEKLVGMSGISQAYVRKLHALSCLLDQADDREEWLRALDRPVPVLKPLTVPAGTSDLDRWAAGVGEDPTVVRRLNPALVGGRIARADKPLQILAPVVVGPPAVAEASTPVAVVQAPAATALPVATSARTHVVGRGESLWTIARRYKLQVADLMSRNALRARSVLRPGMVLQLDAPSD